MRCLELGVCGVTDEHEARETGKHQTLHMVMTFLFDLEGGRKPVEYLNRELIWPHVSFRNQLEVGLEEGKGQLWKLLW
jgi:hypothetical protein